MILELLLIPSAPRPAPGSVTQCQAGQPPCSGRPALPPARSHPSAHAGGWDGVPGSLCAFSLRGPGPHVPPRVLYPPIASPPLLPLGVLSHPELFCAQSWVIPKGNPTLVWGTFKALSPLQEDFGAEMGVAPQKGCQALCASVSLPPK